jgi:hypothetical protein
MESTPSFNPSPEAPKSNRNLIIGVAVAVILCCCCVVTGVAGYYGYQAYLTAQQAVQQFEDLEIPTGIPFDPNQLPEELGEVPQGGLADETTRYTAWLSIQLVGMMTGCETPTAQGATISVSQQPDSNGVWVEEWTANCGNGNSQSFKVTFTPENGAVNVNVEIP